MMQWASWSDFWAMGGYGLYVWGSYAVTLGVLLMEIIFLLRGRKQTVARLKRMQTWDGSAEGGNS